MKYSEYFDKSLNLKFDKKIRPIFIEKTPSEIKRIISDTSHQFVDKTPVRFDSKTLNCLLKFKIDSDIKKIIAEEIKTRLINEENLKKSFLSINSRESLLTFFNISEFELRKLLYPFPEPNYYRFYLEKKNGGRREILAPNPQLKKTQRDLAEVLSLIYSPKISAHGFVQNKSIITNAFKHIGKKYVLNIDLKDFFPSINFGRIYGLFKNEPFKFTDEIVTILAQICCYRSKLPQGAPTSPILSNMICLSLDKKLLALAKKNYITYTRYADDITFSTNKNDFEADLVNQIEKIVVGERFEINQEKIRIQNRTVRQEVTGLTVNQKVNINRKFIRNVRSILHSWEANNYEFASKVYYSKFSRTRLIIPTLKLSLRGKIEYIGSIRGKDDLIYKNLLRRWESLSFLKEVSKFDINKKVEEKSRREHAFKAKEKFNEKAIIYNCNIIHTPKEVVKTLQKFTNPKMKLRNLVHTSDFNEPIDIRRMYTEAMKEYVSIKSKLKYELRREMIDHLFRLYRKELYKIKEDSWVRHPMENSTFANYVNNFLTKIRIGTDKIKEINLEKILFGILQDDSLKNLYKKINYRNNGLNDISGFIDVNAFSNGIQATLKIIKEYYEDGQKIIIKGTNNSAIKKIEINHLGSVANIDVSNFTNKINSGFGGLSKIKNQYFRGVCDWHIESKFIDGKSYRVKVLDQAAPSGESKFEKIDNLEKDFFNHILIMY